MNPNDWLSVLAASGEAATWWIFAAPPAVMASLLAVIYFLARAAPVDAADLADRTQTRPGDVARTALVETGATAAPAGAVPVAAAKPEPEPVASKPEPEPAATAKPKPAAAARPEPAATAKPEPTAAGKPEPAATAKPEPADAAAAKPETAAAKPEPKRAAPKSEPAPRPEPKLAAKQAPLPTRAPDAPAERIAEPVLKPSAVTVAAPLAKPERKDDGAPAADTKKKKKSLFEGLGLTRGGFISKLDALFRGKKDVDKALLDQIEEVMFTADLGVKTSDRLLTELKSRLSRAELKEPSAVWDFLKSESRRILSLEAAPFDPSRARPFVIMVVGVNGVGKTTTIGKLGARLVEDGRKVILAAADTFRAAATEQLEIWGQRSNMPVVKGAEASDPASVIFDALRRAQTENADVVLCDTAGRLHTKVPLMEEMAKVKRVMGKAIPGAPHEVLLVLDATTGQNAINQARMFMGQLEVTGIALTKLDGTAKGGVILGICDELKIPVRFIGIGEQIDDLRSFHPADFVDALFAQDQAPA